MDAKTVSQSVRFDSKKMQKINLFESSRMFCDLYCLEPGQKQNLHHHAGQDKIYYVVDGEGQFTVGTETRTLRSGDIVCAWSGEAHAVDNRSPRPLTCLVFMAPHPQPEKFERDSGS